jgi:hypothetical protein
MGLFEGTVRKSGAGEMVDKAKEALTIYEMIRATSGDRPFFGSSAAQLMRESAAG